MGTQADRRREEIAEMTNALVKPVCAMTGADGYIFATLDMDDGETFIQCAGTDRFKAIVPQFAREVLERIMDERGDANKEVREAILREINKAA